MKNAIHKSVSLFLVSLFSLFLIGWGVSPAEAESHGNTIAKDSFIESAMPQENPEDCFVQEQEVFVIPSLTTIDISSYYTKKTPVFDESVPKYSLPCQYIADGAYAESEMSYLLPGEQFSKMSFQCTWTRLGNTVYIGFLNADTGIAYTASFVSGSASGSIDLSCLPKGTYRVILYSNRNFSTTAVLNYQFS